MKAVVVDIIGKYAVVLSPEGEFIKIKNSGNLQIGYEIDTAASARDHMPVLCRAASIAAAFVLMCGLGIGVYAYNTPYSYVNVDINPSVELVANVFDRVIQTRAINPEGEKILQQKNLKNKKISQGIEQLLESAEQNGYLTNEETNAVLLSVTSKNSDRANEIEKEAGDTAVDQLGTLETKSQVVTQQVSMEERQAAKDSGVSPGKLHLIDKLVDLDPQEKEENYTEAPVKEIVKKITEIKNTEKGTQKSDKETQKEENKQETSSAGNGNSNPKDENAQENTGNNGTKSENAPSSTGITAGQKKDGAGTPTPTKVKQNSSDNERSEKGGDVNIIEVTPAGKKAEVKPTSTEKDTGKENQGNTKIDENEKGKSSESNGNSEKDKEQAEKSQGVGKGLEKKK